MFSSGEENKIDLFEPGTLVFFIMAFVADLCLLGFIGLAIPAVGLAIAMFILMAHWGFGLIIVIYFWGKSHGWLAKLILVLFWILPLPLTLGLALMMIASNKIGAMLLQQIVIQGAAIATGGAAEGLEVVEGAEVAAEGAEAAAEGAEAAGAVAEGAGEAAAAETGGATADAGGAAEPSSAESTAAESDYDKNPLDNPVGTTEGELLQPSEDQFHEGEGFGGEAEEPVSEEEGSDKDKEGSDKKTDAADRLKKAFDVLDRTNQQQPDDENEEEGGEEEEEEKLAA
jgi:hypothetical protein